MTLLLRPVVLHPGTSASVIANRQVVPFKAGDHLAVKQSVDYANTNLIPAGRLSITLTPEEHNSATKNEIKKMIMPGLFDEKLLFNEGNKNTTHFNLPDAELVLRERFFEKPESDRFFTVLQEQTPWQQRERKMYDKIVLDPRLTAWYGDQQQTQWPSELHIIRKQVEAACGTTFNSVLLNYYRDGRDSVSWHSDTKPASGIHQPIASVSFGATRPFHVRHKFNSAIRPFSIPLTHGSFLFMGIGMQDNWEHHIPKTNKPVGPRINLTFRVSG